MAGSPQWKVYDSRGAYQAACKQGEAAACLVALYGPGATVRHGHSLTVWREGSEAVSAGESYDSAAALMEQRRLEMSRAAYVRTYGQAAYDRLMSRA